MKELAKNEVNFSLEALPEDASLKGNVLASGDDETDNKAEAEVRAQLEAGNEWAWCNVKVTATWTSSNGEDYTGEAYLGCCSYESEADFKECAYYEDLNDEALKDLNTSLSGIATDLEELAS